MILRIYTLVFHMIIFFSGDKLSSTANIILTVLNKIFKPTPIIKMAYHIRKKYAPAEWELEQSFIHSREPIHIG